MKAMEALADMQRALGQAADEATGVLDRLASVDSEVGLQAQDALDGAALRRLREAAEAGNRAWVELHWSDGLRDEPWLARVQQFVGDPPVAHGFRGATIAEAADACREALEGAG